MNVNQIIKEISNIDQDYNDHFEILKTISSIASSNNENLARDLVLRILDKQQYFEGFSDIINSLVRHVGLMPYLDERSLGLRDSLAYEFFKPLNDDGGIVFHRAQAEVYHKLLQGESVILSAPTSFGKSKIVDSMIELNRYQNIAVVVPTIALIDETRRRLSRFSGLYKIITQVAQEPSAKNIFILTAERLISYVNLPKIDFFVIDEFYKIGAMDRDEERTISLNQAFYRLLKMGGQFYLLGPNIQHIPEQLDRDLKCIFYNSSFATVISEVQYVKSEPDELQALINLLKNIEGQTLIYCKSPARVNEVAHRLLKEIQLSPNRDANAAAKWIGDEYHNDWIFPVALKGGIALHHGRLPRSLAQFSVKLFNDQNIKFLICTSTLIEGVNTSAKNIVIFDHKIGNQKYDFFTFNNIKGRGGRMFKHFIGKVYIFNAPPQEDLPFVDFPFYSQGENVPDGLLIQLDKEDLRESSKTKLNEYFSQKILPLELIRESSAVHPADQISLANTILNLSKQDLDNLLWTGFPKYKQLEYCCGLIWDYFISNGKSGVFSHKQLTLKLFSFSQNQNVKWRIAEELKPGQYAASGPDEAVERILDFDRNWAGYTFPRLLMVLDRIQKYILTPKLGTSGDYSMFASKIECLFKKSTLIALEEFGLPLSIGEKIDSHINISDSIDLAISQIKGYVPDSAKYSSFERKVIEDVKNHL